MIHNAGGTQASFRMVQLPRCYGTPTQRGPVLSSATPQIVKRCFLRIIMMGNMMVRMRRLRRMVNHDDKYFMQHSEGDGDDEYEYDNDNFCAKVSRSWSS